MPRSLMLAGGRDRRAMNRELARLPREVTTAITWYMKQTGMNKADLAHAMGVTPGRVSQVLSGDENLTLRTLAAVCVALDAHLDVKLVPNGGDPLRGDEKNPRSSASPATASPATVGPAAAASDIRELVSSDA